MLQLQSKLPSQGVTIFSVMTELAQRLNALNLSQGFPDFPRHLRYSKRSVKRRFQVITNILRVMVF